MLFQVFSVFLFCVIFAAVVAFVFLPVIIAYKRKHRNKWVVFVLTVFSLFIVGVPGIILWVIALAWSLYKESEKVVVQGQMGPVGPMGPQGQKGDDAEPVVAPLGKAGSTKGTVTVPLSKSGRRK